MIDCTNVHKAYLIADRRVEALRGVDLRISKPGFYAVMGQSGSGKSTLLHLLGALDRPDQGHILIAGRPLHDMTERQATLFRRKGIGIVFQQFNLIPTMTAIENAELPGILAGDDPRDTRQRAMTLLEELGLADRASHRPEALSGGEQQRVAIARSLLFSPPVLLADEPTGALDSANAERLWRLLASLAGQRRMTVLMVTHEPAAAAHCSHIFVLHDGRVGAEISTEGLDAAGIAARYQQAVRAA